MCDMTIKSSSHCESVWDQRRSRSASQGACVQRRSVSNACPSATGGDIHHPASLFLPILLSVGQL